MISFLPIAVTVISANASGDISKFNNLKIRCEGGEDGQVIEVLHGHVVRLEDGGAEAEYYRVTELNKAGMKGELAFTGLRTNDHTAVTTSHKGSSKTIEFLSVKEKFWKVVVRQVGAGSKKNNPYVLTHSCKEE